MIIEYLEEAKKLVALHNLANLVLIAMDEDVNIAEILLCAHEQGLF